jgi:hypothetical protein
VPTNTVFIAFHSPEMGQALSSIRDIQPLRVYYFHFLNASGRVDIHIESYAQNVESITRDVSGCQVIQRGISYTDYITVIRRLSKIIKFEAQEGNLRVYINISSGSSWTAAAGLDACRFWGVDPVFDEGVVEGSLPLPQFSRLTPKQNKVLKTANELCKVDRWGHTKGFARISNIATQLVQNNVLAENTTKIIEKETRAIVRQLIALGYLEVAQMRQETVVACSATKRGITYGDIFKHLD